MHALLMILAQNGEAEPAQPNPLVTFLPLLLIGVVFYFILIRPQQRRQRAQRELLSAVEPGDEVVTVGGLYGVVEQVEDDSVLLQVAPGTVLKFRKSSIAEIRSSVEDEPADEEAGETP